MSNSKYCDDEREVCAQILISFYLGSNPKLSANNKNKEMEKININTSDSIGLMKITHVGKVRAGKIIVARQEKNFKDIFELSNVAGLGSVRMLDIINQGIVEV